METSEFWKLIDVARGVGTGAPLAQRLTQILKTLPAGRLIEFDLRFEELRNAADIGDLWAAGVLMNGGSCSDDGFHYFRSWLIGQGEIAYEKSLISPDSLADLPATIDRGGRPRAQDESLGSCAAEAYEAITGESIYSPLPSADIYRDNSKPLELSDFSPAWNWADYPDKVIKARLPMLWAKYGDFKVAFDRAVEERSNQVIGSVDVPGIGTLRPGDTVIHKVYGPAVIIKIVCTATRSAVLKFGDIEKGFRLCSELFDPLEKPL